MSVVDADGPAAYICYQKYIRLRRVTCFLSAICKFALRHVVNNRVFRVRHVYLREVRCDCSLNSCLFLQSKKEIAKALRVFVDPDNYPVLVHCIHGKDRTGLIVMIIMLLCSVEPEVCLRLKPVHMLLAKANPQ